MGLVSLSKSQNVGPAIYFPEMKVSERWAKAAQIVFAIGFVPFALLGLIVSFLPSSSSFAEWLFLGMSVGSSVAIAVAIATGFVVGGILSAPLWIASVVADARELRRVEQHEPLSQEQGEREH